jgi:hypothetical protein
MLHQGEAAKLIRPARARNAEAAGRGIGAALDACRTVAAYPPNCSVILRTSGLPQDAFPRLGIERMAVGREPPLWRDAMHDFGEAVAQSVPEASGLSGDGINKKTISNLLVEKQKTPDKNEHQPSEGHRTGPANLTPRMRLSIQTSSHLLGRLPSSESVRVN